MNPLYDHIFNQKYVNDSYLRQLQIRHHAEQQHEIAKAVQALRDYCEATRKIAPEYWEQAFNACAVTILDEMNKEKQ